MVFLTSFSAIPVGYFLNRLSDGLMKNEFYLFLSVVVTLIFVLLLPIWVVKNRRDIQDPFFFVVSIFTFSSVADLLIGLENDGIIKGFTEFYVTYGEKYMKTAHGTMICYWDGIVHYAIYLTILAAQSWNQSYKNVGLYWFGSISHSMLVLMPGIFVGAYGVKWAMLLNVPYLIIPFWFGTKFLNEVPEKEIKGGDSPVPSIWRRPIDLAFIIYFLFSTVIACFRGLVVLGCTMDICRTYNTAYEPYLQDVSGYPKIQMVVYMFYFVPYYILAIRGLLYSGHDWMSDWSLIHAGAAAQGQFSYFGAALHSRTPYILRVPQDPTIRCAMFLLNGALFVVPQLFAVRCTCWPKLFQKPIQSEGKNKYD